MRYFPNTHTPMIKPCPMCKQSAPGKAVLRAL